MSTTASTNWIRAGLLALPTYGLLTAWSTLDAQPDQVADPGTWARYVTTDTYLMSHLWGSTGGTILAIFGVFALGAYLAHTRAGRLGLAAMVITALGHALLLVPSVISTFVTPAIGHAYLAGFTDAMQIEFPPAMMATFMLGLLLAFIGNLLLGAAIWRSNTLPKWTGGLWAVASLMFYVLGVVVGQATTGGSLPMQPVGALLMAGSGAWIAASALRHASAQPARQTQRRLHQGDAAARK